MNNAEMVILCIVLLSCIGVIRGSNWAQLAGQRAQNTATPYTPDKWHRSPDTSVRPMWSGRYGHAVVVLNQHTPRIYLTDEQNSQRAANDNPVLVLLGGDDGLPRDLHNASSTSELGIGSGKLRNDVWHGTLSSSQALWQVDDRYFVDGEFTPNLIRSQMRWTEINPGRIPPPFWPTSNPQHTEPVTNEEWIACQDSIKHKLFDPSICDDPPTFCYDDVLIPGCNAQGVWKRDNMWSPRKGFGAAVVNGKIFVIGGRAREYARIDDSRFIGGIKGPKVETSRDHSTIREDLVLKNDIWSSEDQGRTWTLVNPGCEDHQQDVLLETETWSSYSGRNNVGSIGSSCFLSSDCVGVAECKDLSNTNEKVCVCPIFSPREHHSLSVQRRYSVQDDGSIYEEDVMYVAGGFSSIKQSFCADRSCGPADGYKIAMDDIWMSSDGKKWTQIKPAFDTQSEFVGRGSHTSLVVPASFDTNTEVPRDRLLIFGGKTAHPQQPYTTFLNDVWELLLPTEPCCKNAPCANSYTCTPNISDLKAVTSSAEWCTRSGHVTVYERPSTSNAFQPRIYLSGGANASSAFSDVWIWNVGLKDGGWYRDFASELRCYGDALDTTTPALTLDSYLSVDSPLQMLKRYELPVENLDNFTAYKISSVVSSDDITAMSSESVMTIADLASADLYTILRLRGFDYPGRSAREVPNICVMREMALLFVQKCKLKEHQSSYFHSRSATIKESSNVKTSSFCGRGGDSMPCIASDWDGCTPMDGVSMVDVHGLGNVKVPQIRNDVSSIVDELFCRQVPAGRSMGVAASVDSKFIILGGIDEQAKRLYRDAWVRDEESPRAIIKTKPASMTPQFSFAFDSNEDGAHVFEYKLFRDGGGITNWTFTTASIGVDVSWLDDKKGGPGKGWYTIYVRAVDPAGNRDGVFSTTTNVYHWYYVPPIPWSFVAGGIITGLALIVVGYFEYRRRRRRAILQKFALRRLKRRFKLKEGMHQRRSAIADVPASVKRPMPRERRPAEYLGRLSDLAATSSGTNPIEYQSLRKRHDGRPRSSSTKRSESRSATHRSSSSSKKAETVSRQMRNKRRKAKEEPADVERRRRRRRNREKNRSMNLRDF